MKKVLLLMVAIFITSNIIAQQYRESVYLKNGSVIRGVVVEQVPGVSIKIQTSDGSVYAYSIDEVEKITKEIIDDVTPPESTDAVSIQSSGITKGYRFFVDVADTFGVGDWIDNRVEISTTHGYQFNEHFFIGGGIGVHYYYDEDFVAIPIFANMRIDLSKTKVTPFIDMRAGYSIYQYTGAYIAPSVGVRFRLGTWGALNASVGYTSQSIYFDDYWYDYETINIGGITLRVGFEF